MPIRIGRTSTPQEPQRPLAAATSPIAVPEPIGNPAAQVAGAATQAERLAAAVYQEQRDREIQTRVMEVDIERRRSDAEIIDSYLQRQGKDAVENRGDVMAQLQQNQKRVRAGITDREVARVFAGQELALTDAASRQIDAHFRRENLRWQDDTLQARSTRLMNDLGRVSFGEGEDLARGRLSDEAERTRSALLSTIAERGQLLGWDQERIGVEQQEADSQAYGQVIDRLIADQRGDEARAVLEAHGDRISAPVRTRAQRSIELLQRGQRAHSVFQELQGTGTLLEQVEQLDGMELPDEVRRDVASRLEHRARLVSQDRAERTAEALSSAQRFAEEGTPLPPDVYASLEDTGQVWRYEEWRDQRGRQWETTEYGRRARWTTTDQELLRFSTSAQVWDHFRSEMGDDDLRGMVAEWARARSAYQKSVDQAAERLMAPREDVIGSPLSQSEALGYFRRLPDVEDDLPNATGHEAALGRFEKALRDKANELRHGGDKGTRTELLDKAFDILKGEIVDVGGSERVLSSLSTDALGSATFQTPTGPIDANLLTPELREVATAELERRNREAVARGERPVEVTPPVVASMAKQLVDEQNRADRLEDTRRRARGMALLARQVSAFRDDPEFTRRMKEDRWSAPRRVRLPLLGPVGSSTTRDYDNRSWEVRRVEAIRDELAPMADRMDLAPADLEEVIQYVLTASKTDPIQHYDRLVRESTR